MDRRWSNPDHNRTLPKANFRMGDQWAQYWIPCCPCQSQRRTALIAPATYSPFLLKPVCFTPTQALLMVQYLGKAHQRILLGQPPLNSWSIPGWWDCCLQNRTKENQLDSTSAPPEWNVECWWSAKTSETKKCSNGDEEWNRHSAYPWGTNVSI